MIATQIQASGHLFVALFALILHACAVPGEAPSGESGTLIAEPSGPDVGNPVVSEESAKPAEDDQADIEESSPSGVGPTYRILPDDLLKIDVAQAAELSSEGTVSGEGVILLPLVGGVRVGGLTSREAEQHIAKILGKDYLQDPKVSVTVVK